jgi:thioredoxin 1
MIKMALQHFKTAEFDAAVKAAPLAMVDFWADWCGPCKMLGPTVEKLAADYDGRALVGKVNVDEEPDLARRFGVMSIPTVVFLKNGLEFDRKVGLMPEDAFTAVLKDNL